MDWIECGVLLVTVVLVTMLLITPVKRLAVILDAIDYPSARRVNMRPVPRLGGVAMLGGMLAALVVLQLGVQFFGWHSPFTPFGPEGDVNYWGVLVGVLVVFGTGVLDDIFHLSPKVKLVGQIIGACMVAASGVLLSSIHNPFGAGFIDFGLLAYPLTVFYLVAFANIINLIDGLDGLAAGISAITAATIFVFAVTSGRPDAALFCILIFGACGGFLPSNFNPASIFMGDSGSLLLGFGLGVVSLFAMTRAALVVSLLVPIIAAGVPIIDTLFAILRRTLHHRPIDEADKGHIHHQLMRAGFSQRTTVLIMWGWTALLSASAVLITVMDPLWRIPLVLLILVVSGVFIWKLNLLGLALAHHYNPRGRHRKGDSLHERGERDNTAGDE